MWWCGNGRALHASLMQWWVDASYVVFWMCVVLFTVESRCWYRQPSSLFSCLTEGARRSLLLVTQSVRGGPTVVYSIHRHFCYFSAENTSEELNRCVILNWILRVSVTLKEEFEVIFSESKIPLTFSTHAWLLICKKREYIALKAALNLYRHGSSFWLT